MFTKPTKGSCSAGRAMLKLDEENLSKVLAALNNPKVTSVSIYKWLNLMTDEVVRERNMQRHRNSSCACEYSE